MPAFYPSTLLTQDYLSYYSRIFDMAAVSVQMRPGNKNMLKRWAHETPEAFRFIVRIPQQATSESKILGQFLETLAPIEEKTLAVVVSVPPQRTLLEDREWLEGILGTCVYHGYSAVVEFASRSWSQDMTYNILRRHGAAVLWSNRYHSDPVITSDFACLHLSSRGNNSNSQDDEAWIGKLKELAEEQEHLEFASVIVDSPDRANRILKMLGMPEKRYSFPTPRPFFSSDEQWSGRVVMCVDLNAFYPSCEELREPALEGKPHAVIMTDQKEKITKGVVSSCSYEARKFGVKSAMPLTRALALCPHLILRPVDMPYYQKVSEKVMGVLEQFADVLEQASIDEAFLDCTKAGSADPYGHAAKIKAAVREQCGLKVSVGVAGSKSIAKIASDYKKPDGLTVVHPLKLRDFLAGLEVWRISGIGPKTQQTLKKIGVETIGQLASCDVQKLMDMFGKKGLWMWKVANGSDDESVQPREDHVSLSTEHTLDEPTKDRDRVLESLKDLVEDIHDRIVRNGYMFRTVGVKLVRSDFTIETRETSFPEPQTGLESIASVIEPLLNKFSLDGRALAVRKVGLRVANLSSLNKVETSRQLRAQKTMLDYIQPMLAPDMRSPDT